jgi:lipopolysaccharide transport system ATP-binding protein
VLNDSTLFRYPCLLVSKSDPLRSKFAVSSKSAIVLNNISKCFKRYGKPIDRLKEALQPSKSRADEFWALRNINIEIEKGETYGIIGQNGSGKSTLLQIIAGTLTPTSGNLQVNGRISALLELGSGFNPEFTGRQNVFLNGQILGLSQMEVTNKFDDIAAFANIGQFIDQPVKSYSSGMMVRLAFAVAINVEPEILIVDEALSVGDVRFQARCMKRIRQLKESGVTILFVSHDASSVKMLCNKALLLNHGEQVMQGKPNKVVDRYVAMLSAEDPDSIAEELKAIANRQSDQPAAPVKGAEEQPTAFSVHQHGNKQVQIEQVQLLNDRNEPKERFSCGEDLTIAISLVGQIETLDLIVGISIRNLLGVVVYGTNTKELTQKLINLQAEESLKVNFKLPCRINRGSYTLTVGVHSEEGLSYDWVDEMIVFEMENDRKCDGMVDLGATVSIESSFTNSVGSIT